jgi:hypothetical protein
MIWQRKLLESISNARVSFLLLFQTDIQQQQKNKFLFAKKQIWYLRKRFKLNLILLQVFFGHKKIIGLAYIFS